MGELRSFIFLSVVAAVFIGCGESSDPNDPAGGAGMTGTAGMTGNGGMAGSAGEAGPVEKLVLQVKPALRRSRCCR